MATILGLLLVVTVIANYLATTLPAQMSVNDLNHEIAVENQLGHLQALLTSLAKSAVDGSPAVQPVTLGSDGAPPFAAPDGATISTLPPQQPANLSFGLISTRYSPPLGWVAGGSFASSCSGTNENTSITCTGQPVVSYNFSNAGQIYTFSIKGGGGADLWLNYSTNESSIYVNVTGIGSTKNGFENVQIVGNYNDASIAATGGAYQNVTIIGNHNTVGVQAAGGTSVIVRIIGNNDTVTVSPPPGQSGGTVLVEGWGSYDTFTAGGGGTYNVYFTGFNPENPSSSFCPYGNLSSTDTVTAAPKHANATVTYNNTEYNNTQGGQVNGWTTIYNTPSQYACIYFPQFSAGGASVYSAGLLVSLRNTYAPAAEVAFDQGAVIYAQPGGYPIMIDPPAISYAYGAASVVLPAFLNTAGTESGLGTAVVALHLISVSRYAFPGFGWVLNPSQPLKIKFQTPYAYAWVHYFSGEPAFAGHVTCRAPSGTTTCTGPYYPGQAFGTVTFTLPATSLSLVLAVFSLSLH